MSLIERVIDIFKVVFFKLYDLIDKVFSNPHFQSFAPIVMDFASEAYHRVKNSNLTGEEKKQEAAKIVLELAIEAGIKSIPKGIINGAIEDVHRYEWIKNNPDAFKEIAISMGTSTKTTARERGPNAR